MPRTSSALLESMRSAYEPADSIDEWLGRLASRTADLMDASFGSVGRILELGPETTRHPYRICVHDDAARRAFEAHESQSAQRIDFLLSGAPALRSTRASVTTRLGSDPYLAAMMQRFTSVGIADLLHLTAFDGDRTWVTLGFAMKSERARLDAAHCWVRAGIHFATALRLQRRALDLSKRLPDDAAVLAPDGAVVHAQGSACSARARERLRRAVRASDRASVDPAGVERAFEVWVGLVDGTWSLVDRHDTDGRRFLVAVRNEVTATRAASAPTLTTREASVAAYAAEGYSDKWIAYALGIQRTTVATHLKAALAKLALDSRAQLAKAFRAAPRT